MRASRPSPSALRVVVADDSDLVRQHLIEMLTEIGGVEVVGEAADTPNAVARADAEHPEVVVLDIQMPGGGGIEALRTIKARWPEIVVIMLTNHSNPLYRRKCLERGASFFFDKTTEFERVGDTIRTLRGAGPPSNPQVGQA